MPSDPPAVSKAPGVNQRAVVKMSPEEVDAFLREQKTLVMSTYGTNGYIHSVAMWYGILDGTIVMNTKAKSQKVVNLRQDARITCLLEDGATYSALRGVQLMGDAELVADHSEHVNIARAVFDRNYGPYTDAHRDKVEASLRKRVGIIVRPKFIASWDHRKLKLSAP